MTRRTTTLVKTPLPDDNTLPNGESDDITDNDSQLGFQSLVTNQPSLQVFITGNDYLTIIDYRNSLCSLLSLLL